MHSRHQIKHPKRGQSLVEILVAVAIGGMIIGSAVVAIRLSLQSSDQVQKVSSATPFMSGLIDTVRSTAEGDWYNNLYNLSNKGASSKYYFVRDNTLKVVEGEEGVLGEDVAPGLVGYWKLDEAGVTVPTNIAYDVTANNNKGTLINGPTPTASANCKIGRCLSFDGSNDYVQVDGSSSSLQTASTLSVFTWVNLSDTANRRIIQKDGSTYTRLWELGYYGGLRMELWHSNGSTTCFGGNCGGLSQSLTPNQWSFVGFTFDGTDIKVYYNGTLVGTKNFPGDIRTNTGTPLFIGANWGGAEIFSGKIDDARVYNRALSAAEVFQLYSSKIYNRYFSVENVNRTVCGRGTITTDAQTSCGNGTEVLEDPSTQKVVATVATLGGATLTSTEYIVRSKNSATLSSDWGGVVDDTNAYTIPTSNYSSANNINFSASGEITLP